MRLIDADALPVKEFLVVEDVYGKIGRYMVVHKAALDAAPTIEAEPVQHAYWEPSEVGEYHCTNCGAECDIDEFHKALLNLFCGKCGARMDGGADMMEMCEDDGTN